MCMSKNKRSYLYYTFLNVFKLAFIVLTTIFVSSQLQWKSTHLSHPKQHLSLIHKIIQQHYIIQQMIACSNTASSKMHMKLSISSQNSHSVCSLSLLSQIFRKIQKIQALLYRGCLLKIFTTPTMHHKRPTE